MGRADFWDSPRESADILKKRRGLERRLETLNRLRSDQGELEAWRELVAEGESDPEVHRFLERLDHELAKLELELKLSGEHDEADAIVTIHSGAGGTESQDWADMLLRMYLRWAESSGYTAELLDRLEGEEAGIKSATFAVRGEHAYGYLKGEKGVHRLVRISPFNAQGKRQTAFAAVDVVPMLNEGDVSVDIDEKDIKMDVFRASGAGGQHVNKTSSAVRLTHVPTGIVVSCQVERSQFQNRDRAMAMLTSRLAEVERERRAAELDEIRGDQQRVGFGSQIRSYVMQPYQMVKDLRSEYETGNVGGVLDGDLDPFMEAYLQWRRASGNGTS